MMHLNTADHALDARISRDNLAKVYEIRDDLAKAVEIRVWKHEV